MRLDSKTKKSSRAVRAQRGGSEADSFRTPTAVSISYGCLQNHHYTFNQRKS